MDVCGEWAELFPFPFAVASGGVLGRSCLGFVSGVERADLWGPDVLSLLRSSGLVDGCSLRLVTGCVAGLFVCAFESAFRSGRAVSYTGVAVEVVDVLSTSSTGYREPDLRVFGDGVPLNELTDPLATRSSDEPFVCEKYDPSSSSVEIPRPSG